MSYSMHLLLTVTTLLLSKIPGAADDSEADAAATDLTKVIEPAVQRLRDLVEDFRRQGVHSQKGGRWRLDGLSSPRR